VAIHRRLPRELTNSGRRVPAIGAPAKYRGAAVVGVDGSVESFTAVRWAAKYARLRECPLVVVHAGESVLGSDPGCGGRGGFSGLEWGFTASTLAALAPCPVLIARALPQSAGRRIGHREAGATA
jgi:nucleotide-binding universal stress UspA family protein